jgi:hypothetical protein
MIRDDRVKQDPLRSVFAKQDVSDKIDIKTVRRDVE